MLKFDSLTTESPRKDIRAAIRQLTQKIGTSKSSRDVAGAMADEPNWQRHNREMEELSRKRTHARSLLKPAAK